MAYIHITRDDLRKEFAFFFETGTVQIDTIAKYAFNLLDKAQQHIKEQELDYGILKISANQLRDQLKHCETALEKSQLEVEELKRENRILALNMEEDRLWLDQSLLRRDGLKDSSDYEENADRLAEIESELQSLTNKDKTNEG